MNNSPDNRKWVAFSLSDSTNNQLYSTNLITLRHVNIPYDSALNETEQNKEKKVGVFPIRYIAVLGFQPHENWEALKIRSVFQSAISRYLVSDLTPRRQHRYGPLMFQSAISRYLVSNPTSKTPPLTSGGGNGLHTPRRIDHIPTFASLNSDKNTRSTHYTPNAGIELSETTPPPLPVNPVQNCV